MRVHASGPGWFLRQLRIEGNFDRDAYPFSLPPIRWLCERGAMALGEGVTFLVGENGSGKSTIIEAIAVAAGMNAEGGSQHYNFSSRSSESVLGSRLILRWGTPKPRTKFFLRAESYYNVASELERLDEDPWPEPLLPRYGGVSPHERSHGQSFLDLATWRFRGSGFYILDEPEAALSVSGCMAMLARIAELVAQGSQFLIATHSPILLALPGARILQIDDDGSIAQVSFDGALPVSLTREFLASPESFTRHLVDHGDA